MRLSILALSLSLLFGCVESLDVETSAHALQLPAPPATTSEPTIVKKDNTDKTISVATTTTTRPQAIAAIGELKPELVPAVKPEDDTASMGGEHKVVTNIPPGHLVGSFGAGPCIILVIWSYDGTVYTFHFYAGQDVAATLAPYKPFLEESHAALAGGDNGGLSNQTIQDIRDALVGQNVIIDGFFPGTGLWATPDGLGFKWVYRKLDAAK